MFTDLISKKLTRSQRQGRKPGSDKRSQAGGTKPPPGFAPVPNSKHGGYRKRHGSSWVYWYPDSGVGSHGADDHEATMCADRAEATEGAVEAGEKAAEAGKSRDEVAAAMMQKVDTSNPVVVAQANAELRKFNVEIVGDDKEAAEAVALLYAQGLSKDEDFCAVAPPACAGNMGIPRHDMPQIMGDTMAQVQKDAPWKYDEIVRMGGDVSDDGSSIQAQFLDHLEAQGVKIDRSGKPMKVGDLKATQSEIQAKKAVKFAAWILADKFPNGAECTLAKSPIVVTSDGYILDGHHRYAAVRLTGAEKTIPTVQVGLPMAVLLSQSLDFPGVFRATIGDEPVRNEADAKRVGAQWPRPDFAAYAAKASENMANYAKSLPWRDQLLTFAKGAGAEPEPEPEPEPKGDDKAEGGDDKAAPKWPHVPSEAELDRMIEEDDARLERDKAKWGAKPKADDKPADDKVEKGDGLDGLRSRLAKGAYSGGQSEASTDDLPVKVLMAIDKAASKAFDTALNNVAVDSFKAAMSIALTAAFDTLEAMTGGGLKHAQTGDEVRKQKAKIQAKIQTRINQKKGQWRNLWIKGRGHEAKAPEGYKREATGDSFKPGDGAHSKVGDKGKTHYWYKDEGYQGSGKAPAGFTPIPGSKSGGYRKRKGDGYEYWYPNKKSLDGLDGLRSRLAKGKYGDCGCDKVKDDKHKCAECAKRAKATRP